MNMFLFSINIYVGLCIIEIIYMNNIIEIIQANEKIKKVFDLFKQCMGLNVEHMYDLSITRGFYGHGWWCILVVPL